MKNGRSNLAYWRPLFFFVACYGCGIGLIGLVIGLFVGWPVVVGALGHLLFGLVGSYYVVNSRSV